MCWKVTPGVMYRLCVTGSDTAENLGFKDSSCCSAGWTTREYFCISLTQCTQLLNKGLQPCFHSEAKSLQCGLHWYYYNVLDLIIFHSVYPYLAQFSFNMGIITLLNIIVAVWMGWQDEGKKHMISESIMYYSSHPWLVF